MKRFASHAAKAMHTTLTSFSVIAWEAVVVGALAAIGLLPRRDSPFVVGLASAIVITTLMILLASAVDADD